MKNLIIVICAAIAVTLAVLLILQTRQLREARQEIEALEKANSDNGPQDREYESTIADLNRKNDENTGRISTLERTNRGLTTKNRELEAKLAEKESLLAKAEAEDPGHDEGAPDADGAGDAVAEKKGASGGGQDMGEYLSELMKNPEMVKLMRRNQKNALDMIYGDLFKKLSLSEEELDAFKELLVDRQMVMMELGVPLMKGGVEEAEKERIQKRIKEENERINNEIKMLVGEAGFSEFEDYSSNLGDRMAMGQFRRRLEGAGVEPLEERQEEELLRAIKEEREDFEFSASFSDPGNFDLGRFTDENVSAFVEERQKFHEQVLRRSEHILTEGQLKEYRATIENQLKMERIQMEMAARMFGTKDKPEEPADKETPENGPGDETSEDE